MPQRPWTPTRYSAPCRRCWRTPHLRPHASTVEVAVEVEVDVQFVDISVRDTGAGVPVAQHSRLVKPFERGTHESQPLNGKGMGLAIAHTVATAHGGDLTLDSCSPSGLCATLRIPRYAMAHLTPHGPPHQPH